MLELNTKEDLATILQTLMDDNAQLRQLVESQASTQVEGAQTDETPDEAPEEENLDEIESLLGTEEKE